MFANIITNLLTAYPNIGAVLINKTEQKVDWEFLKLSINAPLDQIISKKAYSVEKYGSRNIAGLSESELEQYQNYYKVMLEELNHLIIVQQTLPFLFQGIEEMRIEIIQLKKDRSLAKLEIETLNMLCTSQESSLSTFSNIILKNIKDGNSGRNAEQ